MSDDDRTLPAEGEHFVAGLLDHVEALTAIHTPTLNGFKRYEPG